MAAQDCSFLKMAVGAAGCLIIKTSAHLLPKVLRKVQARNTFFSPSLAKQHREHLMSKLDLHDTAGLTRYAISAGIIESSVQLTIV